MIVDIVATRKDASADEIKFFKINRRFKLGEDLLTLFLLIVKRHFSRALPHCRDKG